MGKSETRANWACTGAKRIKNVIYSKVYLINRTFGSMNPLGASSFFSTPAFKTLELSAPKKEHAFVFRARSTARSKSSQASIQTPDTLILRHVCRIPSLMAIHPSHVVLGGPIAGTHIDMFYLTSVWPLRGLGIGVQVRKGTDGLISAVR